MSTVFEALGQRLGRSPLWIDFERYAAQVFAGGEEGWYSDAHRFAATLTQARSQVRSDVLGIPALKPYLVDGGWAASAASGVSLSAALDRLSEHDDAKRFLADALDALFHRLDGKAELVLELPSPSRLLRQRGAAAPLDFGDMDDVATALTSVLRDMSTRRFAALVIACDELQGLSEDEWDACGPLVKAARYYGWGIAVRLDGVEEGHAPDRGEADAVLLGRWSDAAVGGLGSWAAGGLPEAFWRDVHYPVPKAAALRFGMIPPDAVPEQVAQRMQALLA